MAHTCVYNDVIIWRAYYFESRVSCGTIYLHHFLGLYPLKILGISAFYHDSASALIIDGNIIAAAQEERFSRKRHDAAFPENAINYCLEEAQVNLSSIDLVVFYDKPFLKFERLIETYLSFAPQGFLSFKTAIPIWLKEKLFQKNLLHKEFMKFSPDFDWKNKLLFSEHHQSHAASAFFPSPYSDAAILTMDGVGEWATTSLAIGTGNFLEVSKEIHFPNSLGLLYSAFTYYTGFKVNSGEYKVMGLAPYGEPKYIDTILEHLIDVKEDGSFRMDQSYFDYCTGLRMTNEKFHHLFGGKPRKPEEALEQKHMDLAASIQTATEEIMLKLTRNIAKITGQNNLCLAGGVALNCVANGKILRDSAFKNVWVQPAAGDAGGAIGAALSAYHMYKNKPRLKRKNRFDCMNGSYLGPKYSKNTVKERLSKMGAVFDFFDDDLLFSKTAQDLAKGKAVGWFQGRMEFGPRALGNRSILADPRSPTMQRTLNLRVKYRESFRPFAPSVLAEDAPSWFELDADSPYMLMVAELQSNRKHTPSSDEKKLFGLDRLNLVRSEVPAVTHVDYSARVQTVHKETNPRYYQLISAFKEITGCPILVNTSFNIRGEPIVCSPEDAFKCFMGTDIEILVVENCYLKKENQNENLRQEYKQHFELD